MNNMEGEKMFENSPEKFSQKWSINIADKGFAAIPNCLLFCQADLGLKGEEAVVLLHLLAYYWEVNSKIYPSSNTIGKSLGKTNSTVRRKIQILEKKGFVKRIYRVGQSNFYEITPTINKLKSHVDECKWGMHKSAPPSAKMPMEVQASLPTNKENITILNDKNFIVTNEFSLEEYCKNNPDFERLFGPYSNDNNSYND
jgi:predicted transcriptional regulator